MITLCIRYTFNPNKLNDFKAYVEAEQGPIARSGAKTIAYSCQQTSPDPPMKPSD